MLSKASGDSVKAIARRLVQLDLIAGDREAALRHAERYRAAGGDDLKEASLQNLRSLTKKQLATANIPGPIRSFARMAALSPDLSPGDLLPALARNIVTNGYQASASAESSLRVPGFER